MPEQLPGYDLWKLESPEYDTFDDFIADNLDLYRAFYGDRPTKPTKSMSWGMASGASV